jgi:hypothetical protein
MMKHFRDLIRQATLNNMGLIRQATRQATLNNMGLIRQATINNITTIMNGLF